MQDISEIRRNALQQWTAMDRERSSWMPHWQELSKYFAPRSGRFFESDTNDGQKKHNAIYDNTPLASVDVLQAGLMSSATSPARPWFKLQTPDRELNKYGPVKLWLAETTQLMRDVFLASNTYRAFQHVYAQLGVFGTASSVIYDDFDKIVRHKVNTIGQYALALDGNDRVNAIAIKHRKTVCQLVDEYGLANVSASVRNAYERHQVHDFRDVLHIIHPRKHRDESKKDARNMPFASTHIELGGDSEHILRDSGFRRFPAIAPRWATEPGDIYGHSPGMKALGDVKQLQQEQLRKAQAIDYQTKPPLQVPSGLSKVGIDWLPGGENYYDATSPHGGVRSLFEVRLDLQALLLDIQDVRQRIRTAFYSDLFLMLANQTDTRMTATEVAERHEEKLLMLGPVTEALHNEMLSPSVDITFDKMLAANVLPPIPQELKGMDIQVEYVSVLAQAQRAVGTNAVDRFVANLGAIAQIKPEVIDKLDADEWVDAYSDMLGVDPKMIVANEKVAIVRQQRAQAQAQAAAAEQEKMRSETIRNVGSVDPAQAADVMGMFSGYSTPSGV